MTSKSSKFRRLLMTGVSAACLASGATALAQDRDRALIERGEYLVEGIAACGNCHTPRDDDARFIRDMNLAGAYIIEEPEFTAWAPNITPDPETGIGNWTDEEIGRAIREGIRPDGQVLGPPMAFLFYREISDSDLEAIVAYLRSVPAVRNEVPRTTFRIPLPESWGPPVEHVPDVPRDDPVAYGEYLANPLGHCMDCHTPLVEGMWDFDRLGMGGNVYPMPFGQEWAAVSRNVTPHPQVGIGTWTDEEIRRAITQGVRPDGMRAPPFMAYEMYARMTDEDLDAIIAYLRSIPPQPPLD